VTPAPIAPSIAIVRCPKCGYIRTPADTGPAWQCPACGIAYDKYTAYLARVQTGAPVPGAREPAPDTLADRSIWMLLTINAATLGVAVFDHWNAVALMAAYWTQSVIIGIANVFRILALERFSTEGFRIGGRSVDPTPAVKRQTAIFFAVHYGFFHLAYLLFLGSAGKATMLFDGWFWLCTVAFGLDHLWSHRDRAALDRQAVPNIGTMMFTPYLRIVPMHLTIVLGALFINSAAGMILFGVLKTLADLAMHLVERAQARRVATQT
jgi:hypothetical protein